MRYKIVLFTLLILLLTSCNKQNENEEVFKEVLTNNELEVIKQEETQKVQVTNQAVNKKEKEIENMINNMTLEEKIGQMFMLAFRQDENGNNILSITDDMKILLQKYNVGGVTLFKENIDTTDQTKKLIDDLQKFSKMPLFISVDEEGGRVSRIQSNDKMNTIPLPSNYKIGSTNDEENAYNVGKILGENLNSLGFNMDFAPVADVWTNPKNTVIGDRSYGNDPELVGDMVAKCVNGVQDQNVSAVIKHFPGHGDTTLDTHEGTVIVEHNLDRLNSVEFVPFEKGINADVDAVMIAHIKMPNIITDDKPASLSKEIITDILRKQLDFDGLVITDALEMGAISNNYSTEEAILAAVDAGVDILLMPGDFEKSFEGLLKAVNQGIINEERINESVKRILMVKKKRLLFEETVTLNPNEVLGNQEHREIINNINK